MLLFTGNAAIIKEFFLYQIRLFNTEDSGHGGPFFYHWLVLLIGCFPLSVFALRSFRKNSFDSPFQKLFKLWMIILFLVVLILFSIVKTKIVHYSSLCYFPLSFLGSYVIYKLIVGELQWKKITSTLLIVIGSVIGLAIAALPLIDKYKQEIISSNFIDDPFAIENLNANVNWLGFEWLIGLFLITGTLTMLFFVKRKKVGLGIIGIFIISLITVNLSSLIIAPRIEQYSQGAAIEFYKSLQCKDVYLETYGFKSYAYLFYSSRKQPDNNTYSNMDWLLRGPIDKPAYFVCKNFESQEMKQHYPELKELYRKNGFVFLIRNSQKN